MDKERILRLNRILIDALSAGHNIGEYDEHASWFDGPEEDVEKKAAELESLFDEAVEAGVINKWIEPGDRYRSTCWDWSSQGHARAKKIGVSLADPLGGTPLFGNVCHRITTPTEMVQPINTDKLDNDLCGHFDRVYQEHVRYVVQYREKPVAAIVPLVDLEMVKDIQLQVDPCRWVEWTQDLRQRLGWPVVTFDEEEP